VLVFNYLGHGGEDGLSAERIWEKSDGQNLSNQYKYPLFITITCEFSRFDNPSRPTAGEYTYWNPKVVQLPSLQFVPSDSLALKILMMHSLKTILFGSPIYPIAEALRISKTAIQTALQM
jgi:hypothetical protein